MKKCFKVFGIIALTALIGFSLAACDGDNDGGAPSSLDGSWYSSKWKETFTFDVDALTFTKMNDQGWGERGTFTFTAAAFTTTITDITDDGSTWTPWAPPTNDLDKSPVEVREYVFSGNNLVLNGEHVYVKVVPKPVLPELNGSWYSSQWEETFTFDVAEGTFTKMKDDGSGEGGTFTGTATAITTIITEVTDDGTTWTPWVPPANEPNKSPIETRAYSISGDVLTLNGEHEYVKVQN